MPIGYLTANELGSRLRELRESVGLSQWQLAHELKTQSNRISDWETGKHTPTVPLLIRIADNYDITVSELLDGVM